MGGGVTDRRDLLELLELLDGVLVLGFFVGVLCEFDGAGSDTTGSDATAPLLGMSSDSLTTMAAVHRRNTGLYPTPRTEMTVHQTTVAHRDHQIPGVEGTHECLPPVVRP